MAKRGVSSRNQLVWARPGQRTHTGLLLGPHVLLDTADTTHLSKYWSDGGSSSLPEVVKWHACL